MIHNTYSEIIQIIKYNLRIRLEDYKLYQFKLHIDTINKNSYIITHPKYNKYDEILYNEPNRFDLIMKYIDNLPYFHDITEFISVLFSNKFSKLQKYMFSKGINRLIVLSDLILTRNINCTRFEYDKYIHIHNWNIMNENTKTLIIAGWIMCNQVFSDGNHRTAKYILDCRTTLNIDHNEFIKFIRSKKDMYKYDYPEWVGNMMTLIDICKNYITYN